MSNKRTVQVLARLTEDEAQALAVVQKAAFDCTASRAVGVALRVAAQVLTAQAQARDALATGKLVA